MTAVPMPAAQCCAATSIDEPSRQMICKKNRCQHAENGAHMREQYFCGLPRRQPWHDNRRTVYTIPSNAWCTLMGEVVRSVPKTELEQARVIREARERLPPSLFELRRTSRQPARRAAPFSSRCRAMIRRHAYGRRFQSLLCNA